MIFEEIAHTILRLPRPFVTKVAIDGVDGAGKTVFADELSRVLQGADARVIRASVDGFHYPRAIRYRTGRYSPDGFYRDSYDYSSLKRVLLDPLSSGGSGRYVPALFDHSTDSAVTLVNRQAVAGDILVFDGIFLHRPELQGYWDLSVFLEIDFERSIARLGQRDGGPTDPHAPLNRRYIEGQQLYLRECAPDRQATIVVDNNDLRKPYIIRRAGCGLRQRQ